MKSTEVALQEKRLKQYRALVEIRDELDAALRGIATPPFTGNWRESRQVQSLTIQFTATRGGAPAVAMGLQDIHIEASDLGRALEILLQAKLTEVNGTIEKI